MSLFLAKSIFYLDIFSVKYLIGAFELSEYEIANVNPNFLHLNIHINNYFYKKHHKLF